jgi:LPS O-antigen subunit length determinant protein (WzzB/FepE family)
MISKKNIQHADDVDLLDIILTIWNGKWKIILITFIAVVITFGFQTIQKPPIVITFQANTQIKSISIFDEFEYETYNYYLDKIRSKKISYKINKTQAPEQNSLNLKKIDKNYLLKLFIDKLSDNSLSKEAIKKFGLIDANDFNSSSEYENAVMKKASSIKISLNYNNNNNNNNNSKKNKELPYWDIQFTTADKNKWENSLKFIQDKANEQIQKYLYESFGTLILNLKKLKIYEIENIEEEILESFENYKTTISNRLVFLKEQAQIARSLDLPKNSLENSLRNPTVITKEDNFSTYYMRGYNMIEKEIELIQNRTDDKPFIEDLIELEKQKNKLLRNKDIERIQNLFENTPIAKSDKFMAANIVVQSTQYKKLNFKTSIIPMLILASLIGAIVGIIYVLIKNATQKRI